MQKPKEVAERVFCLVTGRICLWDWGSYWNSGGCQHVLGKHWPAQPEQWMLQVAAVPLGCQASCRSKGQGSTWDYRFSSLLKAQIPLLQYNCWHAPGWICSQITALHCTWQKTLMPPCQRLHVVSIGHFLGWVFLWEEIKLIFLYLLCLSAKNGKKIRVLILTWKH